MIHSMATLKRQWRKYHFIAEKNLKRKYFPDLEFLAMSISFLLQPYSLLKDFFYEVEDVLKNNILMPHLKNLMKRG